jgi:5-methylthioadenosine/S-adenosylhomocysteine deaminase
MTDALTPEAFTAADTILLLPEMLLLPEGPVRDHAVVVADGTFRRIGPAADVLAENPGLTPVRLDDHLLMPGFVDTHHHLTQSFGKALAFGEPSEIFRRVWVPLEQSLDEDAAHLAAKLAALEALRGGFTTVCEAGTRAPVDVGVIAAAARDAGIRCVLGLTCNDLAPDGTVLDRSEVLRRARDHLARFDDDPLIHPSLAVSVPEAGSDPLLHSVSRMCADAGTVFQVHVNEHLASVERSLERRGVRPLEHLHDVGALGPQVLAAHATLLTPREVRLLADTDTAVSYNPVASAWKGNAVAPATTMAAQGIRFGIGTDATRGDAFRLLDAAETAQRLTTGLQSGDSSCGAGWTWLHHATAGGADAAGLAGVTGEISAGQAADFLVVDCQVPEMQPSRDPVWELVRLAGRDQITAVVVAGRLRLWRGWPPDWDGRALVREAAKVGRDVVEAAPVHQVHPPASEHRRRSGVGGAQGPRPARARE